MQLRTGHPVMKFVAAAALSVPPSFPPGHTALRRHRPPASAINHDPNTLIIGQQYPDPRASIRSRHSPSAGV